MKKLSEILEKIHENNKKFLESGEVDRVKIYQENQILINEARQLQRERKDEKVRKFFEGEYPELLSR